MTVEPTPSDSREGCGSPSVSSFIELQQAFSSFTPPKFSFRKQGGASPESLPSPQVQTKVAEPGSAPPPKQEFASDDIYASSIKHEAEETSALRTVLPDPDEKATQPRIVAETAASDYVPSILPISPVADDVATQQGLDEDLFSSTNDIVAPISGGLLAQVFGDDFDAPDVDDLDDVLDWPSEPDTDTDTDIAVQVTKTGTRRAQLPRSMRESWLYNECVPRLRRSLNKRGFISIHQLAQAQDNLGHDERLCTVLLRELDHDDVRVTRSVAHTIVRGTSINEAEKFFALLLRRPPYPRDVLRYMRMDHLQLSSAVIDFVVSSFEMHYLTLHTEEVLVQRILAAREPGCPEAARVNDPEAWQTLFNANLCLVCSMASRYVGKGMDIEDLIQEGCLGLMTGLDHFEPDKVPRLVHYIPNWIFQRITRAIADRGNLIRLPVHFHDIQAKVSRITDEYASAHGEIPPPDWCARQLGMSLEEVERASAFLSSPLSLDGLLEDGITTLDGHRSVHSQQDVFEQVAAMLLRDELKQLLKNLNPRRRLVIELRFGLYDGVGRSLDAVGKELGVTRERARQIEAEALKGLQLACRSKLHDWYRSTSTSLRAKSKVDARRKALKEQVRHGMIREEDDESDNILEKLRMDQTPQLKPAYLSGRRRGNYIVGTAPLFSNGEGTSS